MIFIEKNIFIFQCCKIYRFQIDDKSLNLSIQIIMQSAWIEHTEMGANMIVVIAQIPHSVTISQAYVWMGVKQDIKPICVIKVSENIAFEKKTLQ